MTDDTDAPFQPKWASPPGDTIRDLLKHHKITQGQAAQRLGISRYSVNQLCNGKRNITPLMAIGLGKFFGQSAEFWMNRQAQYELSLLRQKEFARVYEGAILPASEPIDPSWYKGKP